MMLLIKDFDKDAKIRLSFFLVFRTDNSFMVVACLVNNPGKTGASYLKEI
jgi:hypothetical protein